MSLAVETNWMASKAHEVRSMTDGFEMRGLGMVCGRSVAMDRLTGVEISMDQRKRLSVGRPDPRREGFRRLEAYCQRRWLSSPGRAAMAMGWIVAAAACPMAWAQERLAQELPLVESMVAAPSEGVEVRSIWTLPSLTEQAMQRHPALLQQQANVHRRV
jgi:hypothetical protein